jgi:hypothetical protein
VYFQSFRKPPLAASQNRDAAALLKEGRNSHFRLHVQSPSQTGGVGIKKCGRGGFPSSNMKPTIALPGAFSLDGKKKRRVGWRHFVSRRRTR